MRKATAAGFVMLLPVVGMSPTPSEKPKLARSSSDQLIPAVAVFSQPALQRPAAVKKDNAEDRDKVIMILQTRHYVLTVFGGEDHLYSVSTQDGVALADKLSPGELKVRFPELHLLVNEGWACDSRL